MTDSPTRDNLTATPLGADDLALSATGLVSELGVLLSELDEATESARECPDAGPLVDNRLVQVRLGIASSLFTALRCKHAPTAKHGLRVALKSSAWAFHMGLNDHDRDVIEIAALLHDIGIIGVPDQVLLKPASLDCEEFSIMEVSRKLALEILRHACADPSMLAIVENVPAWYDGSKPGYRHSGEQIPLGARMIAIVEAFDAMTSDHVFRRAMPQERAMHELFEYAGSQFDPYLVHQFGEFGASDAAEIRAQAVSRWLRMLDPERSNAYWKLAPPTRESSALADESLFQARLLDNMHDAVVFVDTNLQISQWNHGAERLTGIAASSIQGHPWLPGLLKMRNEKGDVLTDDDCPVACTIRSGVQSLRRLSIAGRAGEPVFVDSHAIPVVNKSGLTLGAVLLLHDASSETSLEERCQNLHEKATKDPLTQVANRAEFDRVHEMFANANKQQRVPCSLMICDLDHFKKVNDTYGHQAGDEVIKSLASLLKSACRPGDLVARYGGEEFVMLFADCDNATAARRAEQIRAALSQLPQPKLEGRPVTASFGVTEIQPGDTPETMLRRADRGLLTAKQRGRNCVVQLGTGSGEESQESGWTGFWSRKPAMTPVVVKQDLHTPVPLKVAVEKLRGFVADHEARILKIDGGRIQLELSDEQPGRFRRRSDRPVAFSMDVRLQEEQMEQAARQGGAGGSVSRTRIQVTITPKKNRDRRRGDVDERAREVLTSFRSYLMATQDEAAGEDGVLRRFGRALTPWLPKKPE
ncbi:MAG: diguanylate cyclase [Pirellulales bacterium]|nr:diguanylate cyclase [Pirellulales bacterium]